MGSISVVLKNAIVMLLFGLAVITVSGCSRTCEDITADMKKINEEGLSFSNVKKMAVLTKEGLKKGCK